MKFIIRSCNSRLWYVEKILIPDLLSQNIPKNDIILINDDHSRGCLKMWLTTCKFALEMLSDEAGVWYLQDDILISDDFYEVALNIPPNLICNAFGSKSTSLEDIYKTGIVSVKNYWMSFPCIYIPNRYIKGFLQWYEQKVIIEGKYKERVSKNKYDDMLFWQFVKEWHPDDQCLNIVPNIIQHVDHVVNGSTHSTVWKPGEIKSSYWLDTNKEDELLERIRRIKQ